MSRHAPFALLPQPPAADGSEPVSRRFRMSPTAPCLRRGPGPAGSGRTDLELAALKRVLGLPIAHADTRLALLRQSPNGRQNLRQTVRAALALAARDGDVAAEHAFRQALSA
ncbi:hypothetical protein [Roseospirillum parvum]|uniref:Uncharacterized protein n=1 Tax=Roseospirillum parvum TaxID=83401 RepID=A0A1G7ZLS3_9PROT|nr:hypothetical protein [Roseospirillum parvum]SDH09537.1 hypothetical protein SAMN05421742_104146 [Roseospirillum parvum]